jgi:hypothetical protein
MVRACCVCLLFLLGGAGTLRVVAAGVAANDTGPYDATFLAGGIGLARPLAADNPALRAGAPWTLAGWVRHTLRQQGAAVIGGFGAAGRGACDCLVLRDGRLELRLRGGARVRSSRLLPVGQWHAVAATYDGTTARLYLDGREVGSAAARTEAVAPLMQLAPVMGAEHFGGSVVRWTLHARALSPARLGSLAAARPDFGLIERWRVGAGWPLQKRSWRGLRHPQDPWTLPQARAPGGSPALSAAVPVGDPRAVPAPKVSAARALQPAGPGDWTVGGWRLRAAPRVAAAGGRLSTPGYPDRQWYAAVVPGTVLTTLVARGVYPDPYYGLDNLEIPEKLSRQDYWYRTEFLAPASLAGRQLTLRFGGINYAAEVWFNGALIGRTRGAFVRGAFDVTGRVRPGALNALAVRVSPPPHPGIPYEKSLAAGPGNNGGRMAMDGPTFIATEGWDWMPPVRDRDTGIWQKVELRASGEVLLHDPHVITRLPLPRTDEADVSIAVSLENRRDHTIPATLVARFGAVTVRDRVRLAPGTQRITLSPARFPALRVPHPRLWWPNGYGAPNLYRLRLSVYDAGTLSDRRTLHFGMRELTYELSLFDHQGRLRRVVIDPTQATLLGQGPLVDDRHSALKRTPNGWAASLTAAGETSAAVQPADSASLAPYLVIRVNGVRIAARGGSWGMDDAMKRVSRARLEPYFRLTRQAHLDIIRNWLGQDTEPAFYRLADRYGLLVLNDFWESTQDFQLQAEDPQLFLANARDVIRRYRNHPSIAVWFGRNEGVPQPILNRGLAALIARLDGTRLYMPSSNRVNLQGSGPYDYRPPVQYFTTLAQGFSVEVGTASLASLGSLEAMMPAADRWPVSDTLAYHDWNIGGNGDVRKFMAAMRRDLGAPSSLTDFERKAQLMDFVSYRAIFEGFNAHLWTRDSGRLLWMTQPAWPSNIWQIYTSDYATAGAYYGVKSACEPLHAQMNLPDFSLAVVNTTRRPRQGLRLESRIVSLHGRILARRVDAVNAAADATTTLPPLDLAADLRRRGLVFVALTLRDPRGARLSENVYWQGRTQSSLRLLNSLRPQPVAVAARRLRQTAARAGEVVSVQLANRGTEPAVDVALTALDRGGARVLPAYYSNNYLTLLPGERRRIEIRCPARGARCARIELRGWNVVAGAAAVSRINHSRPGRAASLRRRRRPRAPTRPDVRPATQAPAAR